MPSDDFEELLADIDDIEKSNGEDSDKKNNFHADKLDNLEKKHDSNFNLEEEIEDESDKNSGLEKAIKEGEGDLPPTSLDLSHPDVLEDDLNNSADKQEQKGEFDTQNIAPEISLKGEISPEKTIATIKFTVKGSRKWNTGEPYIIPIIEEKLQKDYDDIKSSFYFLREPGDEEKRGEIKKSMIRFIGGAIKDFQDQYNEFIVKLISTLTQEIGKTFNYKDEQLNLLIYHIGVLNLYNTLTSKLHNDRIGSCLKLLTGNRVAKYIPSEFIKERVLNWYENNINIFNLPFDGIYEFEEMKKNILKYYYSTMDEFNKKHKSWDNEKNKKSEIIQWFGITNVYVYKRFVERTIF